MSQEKKSDIIRTNRDIKQQLLIRITQLGLMLSDIEQDAAELGRPTIRKARLSAYFKETDETTGSLTQSDILWLCNRYGINVDIVVQAKSNFIDSRGKQHIKRKYGKGEIYNG